MFPSRWKLCTYALIVLLGCAIAAPNLLTAGQSTNLTIRFTADQTRISEDARRAEAERQLRGLTATVSLSAFTEPQRDLDVTARPDGTIELRPTEAAMIGRRSAVVDQSLEILRRRIDALGVAEPTIQRLGADRILVQLPGVHDPKEVRKVLRSTAKLSFHRVWTASAPDGRLPTGYVTLPGNATIVRPGRR